MPTSPTDINDLLCFWDFQEPAGSPRKSQGRYAYDLQESLGPIQRAEGGLWGSYCARISKGQWFRCPRSSCPGLNLHGAQPLSLVVWAKRKTERPWQFLAGMWDERGKRQYGMFTSGSKKTHASTMERSPAYHQTHGYISDTGRNSEGKPACFSYATGDSYIETERWYALGFTWDCQHIRVYVNGVLDALPDCNPFPMNRPIYHPESGGADFTVGQHNHVLWENYPEGTGPEHEGFEGLIGGVAVYKRALEASEMSELAKIVFKSI